MTKSCLIRVVFCLLMAAGGLAVAQEEKPASRPARASPDPELSRALVGAWSVEVGLHRAMYHFEPDGRFTLTFTYTGDPVVEPPGSGTARGAWHIRGRELIMRNLESDTPHTLAGEEERAEVKRIDDRALMLGTTDRRGRPEEVTLARAAPLPQRGRPALDKLAGAWHGNRMTLVLGESGVAIFNTTKGQWTRRGDRLVLKLPGEVVQGLTPNLDRPGEIEEHEFIIDALDDSTLVLTGDFASAILRRRSDPPTTRPATLLRIR